MTTDFILMHEGITVGPVILRLAQTKQEIEAAQALRYDIFYREYSAKPVRDMQLLGRDYDDYDTVADHLIVIDTRIDDPIKRVVGTYRLILQKAARSVGRFYSADEFDIDLLEYSGLQLVELGRSCVHPDYRTRAILQLLWQGIAEYIFYHESQVLFGCASFHTTDPESVADCLSYLYHFHRAPAALCPKALKHRYVSMNLRPADSLDQRDILNKLPPLIKGYLRLGGHVGDGAIIDSQFNTIDVCIIVQTSMIAERYRKHYERKSTQVTPSDNVFFERPRELV